MNAPTTIEERTEKLQGLGCKRKRVEDARFTQGKGNYVDDIKLPDMLFGDFVRSPYGHARILSINTDAAKAVPGVVAVLTCRPWPATCRLSWPTRRCCSRIRKSPS